MKSLSPNLSVFGMLYLIILGLSMLLVIFYDKLLLHLVINQLNNNFFDVFFKYYTHVGDGLFAILFLFGLSFFVKLRYTILGITAFLISGVGSQLLKNVFGTFLRPASFFNPTVLHFVDGVKINYFNSFPSGHTATAFAFFMLLSYVYKTKTHQIVFLTLACLVAFSRIYLSHHFLQDVVFGSILGIASFFVSFQIVNRMNYKHLESRFEVKMFTRKKRVKSLPESVPTN